MADYATTQATLTAADGPYALVETDTAAGVVRTFRDGPATLRDLYRSASSDATFLVWDDTRASFADTLAHSATLAHVLRDAGVEPGMRVAIAMRNAPEWIWTFMAATSIGAIAVAMNSMWETDDLVYGLRDCAPQVLVTDPERYARLADCAAELGCTVLLARTDSATAGTELLADRLRTTTDRIGAAAEILPLQAPAPDDAATIFYTSGSTGHPKGVVSTHRNVVSALLSWELDTVTARAAALGPDSIAGYGAAMCAATAPAPRGDRPQAAALLAVPLFHVTGSHAVFLLSLRAQRKIVGMYKWDAEVAAGLIEAEQINSFVAPPAMTHDLLAVARTTSYDLSSLRLIGGGGAPRPPEQVGRIGRTFAKAAPNNGWGMTETNAIGTGVTGADYVERPATSGRCAAVLDLRVVDSDGAPLPAGEAGELHVRGASVFRGYWGRPDADAASFTADGWFRTGDVATIDADGFLTIVDRIKDLIIRGGENIGCGAVEAALLEHPAIEEAAVYAVPDDRLGEEVGATVYAPADAAVTADELRTFLAPRLARFEIPRYLTIVHEPLPRTDSGKIFKRRIRELADGSGAGEQRPE